MADEQPLTAFKLAFNRNDQGYTEDEIIGLSYDKLLAVIDSIAGENRAERLRNLRQGLRNAWQYCCNRDWVSSEKQQTDNEGNPIFIEKEADSSGNKRRWAYREIYGKKQYVLVDENNNPIKQAIYYDGDEEKLKPWCKDGSGNDWIYKDASNDYWIKELKEDADGGAGGSPEYRYRKLVNNDNLSNEPEYFDYVTRPNKEGLDKLLEAYSVPSNNFSPDDQPEFVNKFYELAKKSIENDSDDGVDIEKLNKEELFRLANVLLMLDDASLAFFEENKDKDKDNFEQLWQQFIKNNSKIANTNRRLSAEAEINAANCQYKLDNNGHLRVDYTNLDGTGLGITMVDGVLTIINKNRTAEPVTEITIAQKDALLNFLKTSGQTIANDEKTKAVLEGIKITYTGENGQQQVCKQDKDGELVDLNLWDGLADVRENDPDFNGYGYDGKEETTDEVSHAASGNASGGTSAPSSAFQEEREPMDSYQFLSSTSKKSAKDSKGRKEAREKFLKEFKKEHVDNVIKTRLGIGGFEIACWGSEEDERKDGRIDPKTGIKAKTKMFGCKFRYGPPPSATLTDGNLKKLSKTDAAAVLKGLKACGALYVTIPGKDKLGSEGYKNMLLGTISSGVVPRLGDKSLSSSSQSFGKGEAGAIWEAFEKAERPDADKIEYALRLAEQLQQLDLTTQRNLYISQHGSEDGFKPGNFEALGDYPTQFLYYARFKNFTENCVTGLNRLSGVKIKEAVRGPDGQWHLTGEGKTKAEENLSNVDKICAKIAMTKIVNNIMDGKLPKLDENGDIVKDASGKIQYEAYDPLDKQKNAAQKITSVMSAYMNAERIGVLKEIDMEVERIEASKAGDKDRGNERTIPTAIQNIDDKYLPKYKYAMSYLKGFKVTVGESDIWGGSIKNKSASEEKLGYTPPVRPSTRGATGTGRP